MNNDQRKILLEKESKQAVNKPHTMVLRWRMCLSVNWQYGSLMWDYVVLCGMKHEHKQYSTHILTLINKEQHHIFYILFFLFIYF